jgi:hypothetical protein
MKKVGLIVFVVCIVVGLCLANFFSGGSWAPKFSGVSINFGDGERGSGNVAIDKRDIDGFDSIEVSGVFQIEFVSGKDFSVEVQTDDNLVQFVRTDVDDGTLKLSLDKKISPRSDLIVRITAPNVKKIESSGVSKITASGIKNDSLAIESSGASKISASGETAKLTVVVSGAGSVNAEDLKAVDADVKASGACKISVNASGSLKTDASGASHITYTGDPKSVDNHQSGVGSVTKK